MPNVTFDYQELSGVQGPIPRTPNAYNDGSLNPPGTMIEVLAGAREWWPSRSLGEELATTLESEYADVKELQGGVRVSAPLAGSY